MAGAGTIRVLVPLDQLAAVLRLVATNVPLGEDAQLKVQDPTREPRNTRLPVRGFQEPRRGPRGPVATAVLLVALVVVVAMLVGPVLLGLAPVPAVAVVGILVALVCGAVAFTWRQRRDGPGELLEFDAPERLRVVRLRQVDDHDGVVGKLRAAGLVVLDGDDRDYSGVRG